MKIISCVCVDIRQFRLTEAILTDMYNVFLVVNYTLAVATSAMLSITITCTFLFVYNEDK